MWKYDRMDEIRHKLLAKGIVDLAGEVDESMALYVREAIMILTANDQPDITIMITSNGGNVAVGLCIYDMLQNYSGEKTGIVNGFCRSMTTVILQACDHRQAMTHARIKIHDVVVDVEKLKTSIILDKKILHDFTTKMVDGVKYDLKVINGIYSRRSGQPLKAVSRLSKENRDLTAKEALAFGLIDQII